MKQEHAPTRISIIVVLVLLGLLGATRSASAEGRGGAISLGAVSGNTVEVNTAAAADGWSGFNIHVATQASVGVALTGITAANDTAVQGQQVCASSVPAAGEYVFACVGVESQSMIAPGLLARFTFAATGNGCIGVSLVAAPGDTTLGTYTIDDATSTAQAVTVSTATARIVVGTGTAADCGGLNALPSGGFGPGSNARAWAWLAVFALAMGALAVGLGARHRRVSSASS